MRKLKMFVSKNGGYVFLVGILSVALVIAAMLGFWEKNPEIFVALVIGLAPSVIVLYVQNQNEKRDRRKWLLEKRASVFEKLVSAIGAAVETGKLPSLAAQEIGDFVKENKPQLVVWAPISVLRDLQYLEDVCSVEVEDDAHGYVEDVLGAVDKLFQTIREELNQDDSARVGNELVRFFLERDLKDLF